MADVSNPYEAKVFQEIANIGENVTEIAGKQWATQIQNDAAIYNIKKEADRNKVYKDKIEEIKQTYDPLTGKYEGGDSSEVIQKTLKDFDTQAFKEAPSKFAQEEYKRRAYPDNADKSLRWDIYRLEEKKKSQNALVDKIISDNGNDVATGRGLLPGQSIEDNGVDLSRNFARGMDDLVKAGSLSAMDANNKIIEHDRTVAESITNRNFDLQDPISNLNFVGVDKKTLSNALDNLSKNYNIVMPPKYKNNLINALRGQPSELSKFLGPEKTAQIVHKSIMLSIEANKKKQTNYSLRLENLRETVVNKVLPPQKTNKIGQDILREMKKDPDKEPEEIEQVEAMIHSFYAIAEGQDAAKQSTVETYEADKNALRKYVRKGVKSPLGGMSVSQNAVENFEKEFKNIRSNMEEKGPDGLPSDEIDQYSKFMEGGSPVQAVNYIKGLYKNRGIHPSKWKLFSEQSMQYLNQQIEDGSNQQATNLLLQFPDMFGKYSKEASLSLPEKYRGAVGIVNPKSMSTVIDAIRTDKDTSLPPDNWKDLKGELLTNDKLLKYTNALGNIDTVGMAGPIVTSKKELIGKVAKMFKVKDPSISDSDVVDQAVGIVLEKDNTYVDRGSNSFFIPNKILKNSGTTTEKLESYKIDPKDVPVENISEDNLGDILPTLDTFKSPTIKGILNNPLFYNQLVPLPVEEGMQIFYRGPKERIPLFNKQGKKVVVPFNKVDTQVSTIKRKSNSSSNSYEDISRVPQSYSNKNFESLGDSSLVKFGIIAEQISSAKAAGDSEVAKGWESQWEKELSKIPSDKKEKLIKTLKLLQDNGLLGEVLY